jgi:methylmalonyl-CoA mutase N-terminal domain/subunit
VIAAESGVVNTVDPVAGSYAIEALTNTIERGAREILDRIEQAGGTLAAIESGLIQREIQESAYRAQLAVDKGQSIVVGVNRFGDPGPDPGTDPGTSPGTRVGPALFSVDADVERRQIERVRAVRASRDAESCQRALAAVSTAAREGQNLVVPIVTAVEARATVGEISDTLRNVFGEYAETATV